MKSRFLVGNAIKISGFSVCKAVWIILYGIQISCMEFKYRVGIV